MHLHAELGSIQLNHSVSNVDLTAFTRIGLSIASAALPSALGAVSEGILSLEAVRSAWIHCGQRVRMDINIFMQGLSLQQQSCAVKYRNSLLRAILESQACLSL